MPNWVENELTIHGPEVQKVLETIRSRSEEDEDMRILDFNQIIPYPNLFREIDQRAHDYNQKHTAIPKDDPQRDQKLIALARAYDVEPGTPWIKDGYNSGGYEWCCENWSTKWNASSVHLTTSIDSSSQSNAKSIQCAYCQTVHNSQGMQVLICQRCGSPLPDTHLIQAFLEFNTPWSPPIRIIEKLASMFPNHTFELKYFEGGMGFSGHGRWCDGEEAFHQMADYDGPRGG